MKTISLCMIVKNEELNLKRCLESVKNVVDEIIIVDTGSTDNTKQIASEFTSQIFDKPWNNNFAEARNFGIEKATKDWILILDADEELLGTKENLNSLIDIKLNKPVIYQVKIISLIQNEQVESFMARLFPNFQNIKYAGAVHEYLNIDINKIMSPTTELIKIKHYGYTDLYEEKVYRNLELLKELEKTAENKSGAFYYIATSYMTLKKYDEALEYFKKWEEDALKNNWNLALGYTQYINCLSLVEKYQEAINLVLPHIIKCWNNADFCFALGTAYENIKDNEKALKYLEKALENSSMNTLITSIPLNKWKVYSEIGNVYIQMAEYDKAFDYWEKAFADKPSINIAQGLISLSFELKNINKLSFYLKYIKDNYPKYKNIQNDILYANILFNENKIHEAIKLFLNIPEGRTYIDQLIAGCLSSGRFADIEIIKEVLNG